jgi:hypothetical protein
MAGLEGCATAAAPVVAQSPPPPPPAPAPVLYRGPRLVPMRVSANELIDIKCCIRPFRPQGCRLDAEQLGDTLVVHNYGHGGSGWSLSWGSAEIAVGKAMAALPTEIAVVGCGIVGLTAAVQAQRAGAKVTIYARELFPRTRSVRANGSWTPDSRIALTDPAGPGFAVLWEQMARISWKHWRGYLGMPERPVEWADSYALSDTPPKPREREPDPSITQNYANSGMPHQSAEFAKYADSIRDIVPRAVDLTPEENPFNTAYARRSENMHFNFAAYGKLLLSEFFQMGGKFENRDFHSPADIVALPQKVVINSPGYAARDLWRDKTIIPVRGQTAWLLPQPSSNYGASYRGVNLLSKSDGVMMMHSPATATSLGDMDGVGNSMELPDRAPIEEGLGLIAPLFANMKGVRT